MNDIIVLLHFYLLSGLSVLTAPPKILYVLLYFTTQICRRCGTGHGYISWRWWLFLILGHNTYMPSLNKNIHRHKLWNVSNFGKSCPRRFLLKISMIGIQVSENHILFWDVGMASMPPTPTALHSCEIRQYRNTFWGNIWDCEVISYKALHVNFLKANTFQSNSSNSSRSNYWLQT